MHVRCIRQGFRPAGAREILAFSGQGKETGRGRKIMRKVKFTGWKILLFFGVAGVGLFFGRSHISATVNLKTASFTAEDHAQFFIAYIYIEDDGENDYNDQRRDVTLNFGEYYITEKYINYADTELYKNFAIIRINGYLPSGRTFFPQLDTSDSVPSRFSWRLLQDGRENVSVEGVRLKEGNNEFFFVGGFHEYVHGPAGEKKIRQIYELCHTEDGGFYGNKAGEIIEKRREYKSLVEQFNSDPSLDAVTDYYGTVYSRQDLRGLGYKIIAGDNEKLSDAEPGTQTEETEIPPRIPEKEGDRETIGRADRIFHYSGLFMFIFCLPFIVPAFFALYKWRQWYRQRKEDEDSYVD